MKKKNIILRTLTILIAATLIGTVLYVINGFKGNPISAALADRAIQAYVEETYPELELELEKSHYNFKFNEYVARASSRTSVDTHFAIYYSDGKVQWDDYDSYVLGKYNTLTRLEKEYGELVVPILSEIEGLENNDSNVQVEKWEDEKNNDDIDIDMQFSRDLPIDMNIMIRADRIDPSIKRLSDILEKAHKALLDNECVFSSYGIFSEYEDKLIMIHGVKPSDIESGELEQRLLQAYQGRVHNEDGVAENSKDRTEFEEGIRITLKEDKTD